METNIVDINQKDAIKKDSACSNPSEQERLLKLFQIFIEIDQNLKKKKNENNY